MVIHPALLFAVGFASLLAACAENSTSGVDSLINQVQPVPELAVIASGAGEPIVTPLSDPAPIEMHGLWNFSQGYSDGAQNVRYVEVTDDGIWRVWDYLGDTYHQGNNCFISNDSIIKRTGGSAYRLINGDVELNFSATVADSELTLIFTSGRSLRLSKVDALSAVDFNRC